MRISFEIDENSWRGAVSHLEILLRPKAPWDLPYIPWVPDTFSRGDLVALGPGGYIWFEHGRKRVGYDGSVLYVADCLDEWLRTEPKTFVIEADSVYQSSAPVEFRVLGTSVEITLRGNPPDILLVALDDARRTVENALREFGPIVLAHLPRIRELADLRWLSETRHP